jgi:formamidopyrimidine-DNA glycosylase
MMLEIPESTTIAKQLNETVSGKTIQKVIADTSPHKFAFYHGEPLAYHALLYGKTIEESVGIGAMVSINAGNCRIVIGDGANLRYYHNTDNIPAKHQLLIIFEDQSALVCTIQMYGAVFAFKAGAFSNSYYTISEEKPLPIDEAFNRTYFNALRVKGTEKYTAKAYLATEQRIPGLGNGVLQDILFNAGIHPKRKMNTVSDTEYERLYQAIKETLNEMTRLGGRDTEKDLFGNCGGYKTQLSRYTVGTPCPICGEIIQKAAYMGGTVYWCPECQPITKQ